MDKEEEMGSKTVIDYRKNFAKKPSKGLDDGDQHGMASSHSMILYRTLFHLWKSIARGIARHLTKSLMYNDRLSRSGYHPFFAEFHLLGSIPGNAASI